ncbi:MAG: Alpha-D-GlcNAc alpha-1,2-L-rhamnosyltransferase (EC [uncultured Caballeronia sp.]|nr:MAG: Alpha-D-GlcNAc alpha-1,2-L-rhamnosyltransferase (EC [uncultured Caballeronia sp.]
MDKTIAILGTRGIPASYGGFETFAERLALYLVERGWRVTVYCQGLEGDEIRYEDMWKGVHRIVIPARRQGALGTMEFDWRCVRDAAERSHYNTAVFCLWLRLMGVTNLINMDGLEWHRQKWRFHERAWLWANERIGCWVGNHLIADHPAIADHLATRVKRAKITTIPYGGDRVDRSDETTLERYGVRSDNYGIVIARPEPENSILEIVQAFSKQRRDAKLVVLGVFYSDRNPYHNEVVNAASEEVLFVGPIYERSTLNALRQHARFYLHGHRVGGTNPSLVEALGAGNAVIAHDNVFNRWVAGSHARFFDSVSKCEEHMSALLGNDEEVAVMRAATVAQFESGLQWERVLGAYEVLFRKHMDMGERPRVRALARSEPVDGRL